MNGALFEVWVQNVFNVALTEHWVKKPVLLLTDGAQSYIKLETAEFCVANSITLYVFLPNATHIMQPLDLQLMGAFKQHYHEEVQWWLSDHLGELFTKWDFAGVFKRKCGKCQQQLRMQWMDLSWQVSFHLAQRLWGQQSWF